MPIFLIALTQMTQRDLANSDYDADLHSNTRERRSHRELEEQRACRITETLALVTAYGLQRKSMSTFNIAHVGITTTFLPMCSSGNTAVLS